MRKRVESLGTRVRRLREERRTTLHGLARQTGITPAFLCDIEHGRRFPSHKTMTALAKALRIKRSALEEVRLTKETSRFLERDPELLRVVIQAARSREARQLILDAAGPLVRAEAEHP